MEMFKRARSLSYFDQPPQHAGEKNWLAAADGVYDFYPVTLLQVVAGKLAARNNFKIDLDRYSLIRQALLFNEGLHRLFVIALAAFAIEDNLHAGLF